jgi:hypothetical protein
MSFGNVSVSPDAQAVAGAELVLNILALATDPEARAAEFKRLDEAHKRVVGALAELKKREQQVLRREEEVKRHEAALAAAESRAAELLARAEAKEQRAEAAMSNLAQLRAELKTKLAAA